MLVDVPVGASPAGGACSVATVVMLDNGKGDRPAESSGADADGKPMHVQYSAKFYGKDYPATGIANVDSVSVKRIDANTIETVRKKDGKVVMTIIGTVSKDGKNRTATWRGKNAEGKDVYNVVVYNKQ